MNLTSIPYRRCFSHQVQQFGAAERSALARIQGFADCLIRIVSRDSNAEFLAIIPSRTTARAKLVAAPSIEVIYMQSNSI